MVDEVTELLLLPVFPRAFLAILDQVDFRDMPHDPVRFRIDEGEGLVAIAVDVLGAAFEAGLHSLPIVTCPQAA